MNRLSAILLPCILAALILAPWTATCQQGTEQYAKKVEEFFGYLAKQKFSEGIDFLYADNPWIVAKSDDVKTLRNQFEGLPSIVGKYVDHTLLVEEKTVGQLACLEYFVTFERQPIRFSFQFYRPSGKWVMHAFEYRDDIDQWTKEKAKSKFMNTR